MEKTYYSGAEHNGDFYLIVHSGEQVEAGDDAYVYDCYTDKWHGCKIAVSRKRKSPSQKISEIGKFKYMAEVFIDTDLSFLVGINAGEEIPYPPCWEEDCQKILSVFKKNWQGPGEYYFTFDNGGEEDEQEIYGESPEDMLIEFVGYLTRCNTEPGEAWGFDGFEKIA